MPGPEYFDKQTALLMIDAMLGQLVALKEVILNTYDGDDPVESCAHENVIVTGDGGGMCRNAECAKEFPPGTFFGDGAGDDSGVSAESGVTTKP